MSDQMKWFKLWASTAVDPLLRRLDMPTRWAWIGAVCYIATHGKKGVLTVPEDALGGLAFYMDVPECDTVTVLNKLPNVTVKTVTRNVTVTFNNWSRFQEDATAAERMRRYRQRRGEENTTANLEKASRPATPDRPMTSGEFADERERRRLIALGQKPTP